MRCDLGWGARVLGDDPVRRCGNPQRRRSWIRNLRTASLESGCGVCDRCPLDETVTTMRRLPLILLLLSGFAAMPAPAAEDVLALTRADLARLESLAPGVTLELDGFPDGRGGSVTLHVEPMRVRAGGARTLVVDARGERELAPDRRRHLLGRSADGRLRAALWFGPGFTAAGGVGTGAGGETFVLEIRRDANGATLRARPAEESLPAGVVPRIADGDDALPSGRPLPDALAVSLAPAIPAGAPRIATLAIDTDNEFMSERFSNNTTAASAWIDDLIATMNVMYVSDLGVRLQRGTTILRTTADPYVQTGSPAGSAHLNEFGGYWQANHGNVPRSFAMLLSGKASSPNSSSGIAWVNSYCEYQSQGGSYSVNQVFRNPQIPVIYSALLVAHELGHNFGAHHTHCTNVATGGAPTGTNTIDRCHSGESGCYSGATSCPAPGGDTAGTIMSYCHNRGCGPDDQNLLQFHPTHVAALSVLVAQNTPSCLVVGSDVIFADGFED